MPNPKNLNDNLPTKLSIDNQCINNANRAGEAPHIILHFIQTNSQLPDRPRTDSCV